MGRKHAPSASRLMFSLVGLSVCSGSLAPPACSEPLPHQRSTLSVHGFHEDFALDVARRAAEVMHDGMRRHPNVLSCMRLRGGGKRKSPEVSPGAERKKEKNGNKRKHRKDHAKSPRSGSGERESKAGQVLFPPRRNYSQSRDTVEEVHELKNASIGSGALGHEAPTAEQRSSHAIDEQAPQDIAANSTGDDFVIPESLAAILNATNKTLDEMDDMELMQHIMKVPVRALRDFDAMGGDSTQITARASETSAGGCHAANTNACSVSFRQPVARRTGFMRIHRPIFGSKG